jgi:2-C-methyl-D-erythritol 4-phosphate cytidylyltransferase
LNVVAIIVAAGPGRRLGADRPKALVDLAGEPLFVHSLRALLACPEVTAAVVVAPAGCEAEFAEHIRRGGPWRCPPSVLAGGAERQDSVRSGLSLAGEADLVAVHDAARPFVAPSVVAAAIAEAARSGAAVVAVPANDTVKQVHPEGWIETTPPREHLWLAQTPQVFRTALLRTAHARAAADGLIGTDDAALVEHLGERVRVVRGSAENRKITTPEDLHWAEWWIRER